MKAIITTTLYRLRKHHACKDRYDHLVSKLGPEWGDQQPINLRKILEYNGIDDCLWAFRAVKHPEGDQVMRLMAADFAEAVLPIYESKYSLDGRPRRAIQAARDYVDGKITAKKRVAAGAAARTAARAAADAATWAAARATGAATRATAWVAAEAAAGAATMAAIKAIKEATWATTRDAAGVAVRVAIKATEEATGAAAWTTAEDVQARIVRKYLCA